MRIPFYSNLFWPFADCTSDRDYKGASQDDDDEVPRISLQEMLEDLHLAEPDSAADMMTEWCTLFNSVRPTK